jgi:HAD superfamily hydrolase (TIGR01490 family)
VDKTLIPGSSLFPMARAAYSRGLIDLGDIARFAWGQLLFRTHGSERERGMALARESTLSFVAGRPQSELIDLGREAVHQAIIPKVYPEVRGLIDMHVGQGYRTYLVTATPIELADVVAEELGMTGGIGTVSELEDGIYTGRLVGGVCHGQAKADAVAALAERDGVDLSGSYAYSDSINDRPLLELVGNPVAVNPDPQLRSLARERGWTIQDFRDHRRTLLVGLPTGATLGVAAVTVGIILAIRSRRRAETASP